MKTLVTFARLLVFLFATGLAHTATAQFTLSSSDETSGFGDSRDQVRVTALTGRPEVPPGSDLPVAVVFEMQPGWHIWANARELPTEYAVFDGAINTTIEVDSPKNGPLVTHVDFMQWPQIHSAAMDVGEGVQNYAVFEKTAIAFLPLTIPKETAPGEHTLTLRINFQSCNDKTCLMPAEVEIPVNVTVSPTASTTSNQQLGAEFASFETGVFERIHRGDAPPVSPTSSNSAASSITPISFLPLITLLLLAALGGFILNFTPCVLPVIPLKIMSLAQSAGNRRRTFQLGLAMCLGVIAFWLGLGVAIASISQLSTNELFQYPWFPITVGAVIAIMAVGMGGLFSVRLPNFVYAINPSHDSYHGSFGFGIMTAILSTPCTAPFMGTAITASVGQSSAVILSVFFAIGFGMALPYLILAANPKWIDKMPRTGPASELIKHVMGILMLSAAAYFIGIGISGMLAGEGEAPSKLYWWFVALFVIIAGAWLVYRTIQITPSPTRRAIFSGLGALMIAGSVYAGVRLTEKPPIEWMYYTPERLDKELGKGNVVMLKFTAEWCANCHFLEHTVIDTQPVIEALGQKGVTPMKVDITNKKSSGNQLLVQYWRSIPYLVILRPDRTVTFQADWYTASQVVEGIDQAMNSPLAEK